MTAIDANGSLDTYQLLRKAAGERTQRVATVNTDGRASLRAQLADSLTIAANGRTDFASTYSAARTGGADRSEPKTHVIQVPGRWQGFSSPDAGGPGGRIAEAVRSRLGDVTASAPRQLDPGASPETIVPSGGPVAPALLDPASATDAPGAPVTDTELRGLLEAFGTVSGDDGYTESYDSNGDGAVDVNDLLELLARINRDGLVVEDTGGPARYTSADLEGLLKAFGTSEGQSGYDVKHDRTGDGRIDVNDLLEVLSGYDENAPVPAAARSAEQSLEALTRAFGLSSGDEGFDQASDIDGNGTIDANDLLSLLHTVHNGGES